MTMAGARGGGIAAIVPAAGASRRFGGMKLLAGVAGEPLLQHTLRSLLDAALPVLLVAAPAADLSSVPLAADPRVTIVINPDPERGMFSSIQCGLSAAVALDPGCAALVLPADMPFVRAATVALVVDAHRRGGDAVVAVHEGRRGHPVVLPAGVPPRLTAQPATSSLKDSLRAIGVTLREVAVDDGGVLRDVDVRMDLP